jgi:hypothetical protein
VNDFDSDLIELISQLTDECQVLNQMPGAIWPEEQPNLIRCYAADEPEAIAEVRSRHGVE